MQRGAAHGISTGFHRAGAGAAGRRALTSCTPTPRRSLPAASRSTRCAARRNGSRRHADFDAAAVQILSRRPLRRRRTSARGGTPGTTRACSTPRSPSASAPAALLDVQPGMRVADLCAAPGGKTSQLAAALQGRGLLLANEFVAARAEILRQNLERMGVANAVITQRGHAPAWPPPCPAGLTGCSSTRPARARVCSARRPPPPPSTMTALVAHCAELGDRNSRKRGGAAGSGRRARSIRPARLPRMRTEGTDRGLPRKAPRVHPL